MGKDPCIGIFFVAVVVAFVFALAVAFAFLVVIPEGDLLLLLSLLSPRPSLSPHKKKRIFQP
jgi:hypothetical protein